VPADFDGEITKIAFSGVLETEEAFFNLGH
jgi:hypothetical protein